MTNLDSETANAGETIIAAWEYGALEEFPGGALLTTSPTNVQAAVRAAINADTFFIPAAYAVDRGQSGAVFVAARLRVPTQSDGMPYSQLLAAIQNIPAGAFGLSATLISADYSDPTEDPSPVVQALAGADQGFIGNTVSSLQASIAAGLAAAASGAGAAASAVTPYLVGGVVLVVALLWGIGSSGLTGGRLHPFARSSS
jgi:hypothetical protein